MALGDLLLHLSSKADLFLLVFARISGIFLSAPVFATKSVPVVVKAGLSFCMAIICFNINNFTEVTISSIYTYAFLLILEMFIGITIGFIASLAFNAIYTAGQLLDMQIGFGVVSIMDPQLGQQVPIIGNLKNILATLFFLCINGHHVIIVALFKSFSFIPLHEVVYKVELAHFFTDLVYGLLITAVKIAMPLIIALLMADIAMGILMRTMPNMNIFVIGMPLKILVGLIILIIVMPTFIFLLEVLFNEMYKNIFKFLQIMATTE